MPDPFIESIRAVLTKADAHDAAVTSATVARQKLATAEAEIIRLTALVNQAPVPVTPVPVTLPPVTTIPPVTAPSTDNLILRGNKIFRPTGQQVIARGPELTVADYPDGIKHVDAIAATGANAMRMLLTLDAANGRTQADFDAILSRAAFHRMIVWVSLYTWHDEANNVISPALGGGNFYSLNGGTKEQPAACYLGVWQRKWLKDLMHKHRATVIIDAAQEYKGPSGVSVAAEQEAWAVSAEKAVRFFRAQGYTQPLEIMANWQGRDLAGIIRLGDRIRQADTVRVNGDSQTMFGWQAYWGTADEWYPKSQGELLLGAGRKLSAAAAMTQFVSKAAFPIQCGFDNFAGDTNLDWKAQIDAAAALGLSWLWWSWLRSESTVEAPVSGAACQTYVLNSPAGFKGAIKA